jgi:glutamyl-tRNA synthetase
MAPAPSGFLHLGNVRTFLFDYLYARGHGGALVLRIEDTDAARSTPAAEEYIRDALHWLGIDWDEGPDVGGPFGPYRQSEREGLHREAAHALKSTNHAYDCFCTTEELAAERSEQDARGEPPRYSRRCLTLTESEKAVFRQEGREPAMRFLVPDGQTIAWNDLVYEHVSFQSDDIGDFVILRPNGAPIYNLANVVDDHGMQITVGLRSQSHLSNTPRQLLLYDALGWDPPAFVHVPDVSDLQGRKLGKRYGAKGVTEYRAEGYLPEAVVNYMALLGWSSPTEEELLSLEELCRQFSFDRVQRSNAAFDGERLEWFNSQYLRRIPIDDLVDRAIPFCEEAGLFVEAEVDRARSLLQRAMPLVQERVRTLVAIPTMVDFFFRDPCPKLDQLKIKEYAPSQVAAALESAANTLAALDPWTSDSIVSAVTETASTCGWTRGDLFIAIRVAITGRTVSPPLTESMEIVGRDGCIGRMRNAMEVLSRG